MTDLTDPKTNAHDAWFRPNDATDAADVKGERPFASKSHVPITQGLRCLMKTFDGPDDRVAVKCELTRFEDACDAIDAVHASLENENEELRKKLAARRTHQVGTCYVEVHLDIETLARDLEEAGKMIRSMRADGCGGRLEASE